MNATSRCLPVLFVLLLLASCADDDPARPGPGGGSDAWVEADVPDSLAGSTFVAVDAADGRAIWVSAVPTLRSAVLDRTSGEWAMVDPGWPAGLFARDFLVTGGGQGVVVGAAMGSGIFVSVEQPDWSTTSVATGSGALRAVIQREDGSILAVGDGTGGATVVSGSLGGTWTRSSLSLPGTPNEAALVAVVEIDGVVYACGFNDGADGSPSEPDRFVMADAGSGFEFLDGPCTDCRRHEFTALAASTTGALLLGGAITDFGSSDPADWYTAVFASYSAALDEWTELVLPDAAALDRVNDILVAADGTIVLACGADGSASLVVKPLDGPAAIEWTSSVPAGLFDLSEGDDGTLHAVGWTTVDGTERPLWLERPAS